MSWFRWSPQLAMSGSSMQLWRPPAFELGMAAPCGHCWYARHICDVCFDYLRATDRFSLYSEPGSASRGKRRLQSRSRSPLPKRPPPKFPFELATGQASASTDIPSTADNDGTSSAIMVPRSPASPATTVPGSPPQAVTLPVEVSVSTRPSLDIVGTDSVIMVPSSPASPAMTELDEPSPPQAAPSPHSGRGHGEPLQASSGPQGMPWQPLSWTQGAPSTACSSGQGVPSQRGDITTAVGAAGSEWIHAGSYDPASSGSHGLPLQSLSESQGVPSTPISQGVPLLQEGPSSWAQLLTNPPNPRSMLRPCLLACEFCGISRCSHFARHYGVRCACHFCFTTGKLTTFYIPPPSPPLQPSQPPSPYLLSSLPPHRSNSRFHFLFTPSPCKKVCATLSAGV